MRLPGCWKGENGEKGEEGISADTCVRSPPAAFEPRFSRSRFGEETAPCHPDCWVVNIKDDTLGTEMRQKQTRNRTQL